MKGSKFKWARAVRLLEKHQRETSRRLKGLKKKAKR